MIIGFENKHMSLEDFNKFAAEHQGDSEAMRELVLVDLSLRFSIRKMQQSSERAWSAVDGLKEDMSRIFYVMSRLVKELHAHNGHRGKLKKCTAPSCRSFMEELDYFKDWLEEDTYGAISYNFGDED